MAAKTWPAKDPEEVLDYGFDWSPRQLDSDTIATTTATLYTADGEEGEPVTLPAPAGWLAIDSHEAFAVEGVAVGQSTVTWLSGGTAGETYYVNLHAVTVAGRELEQRMKIKVKER